MNCEHIQNKRKFIKSYDLSDYEIMTDTGWQDAKAIHKTTEYQRWCLVTDGHELECADDHIVFLDDFTQVFVKDLQIGQKIWTDTGLENVIDVFKYDEYENMYDIELDDDNHRYYTNGILSHNTTTYTILVLWMATLFPERKIMICANKLQTAIEIVDRIRIGYEYLPAFLKPGVTVYNKQEISFANKSTIRAFATSSSASRGFSAQCVIIDEMSFIPKNVIEEFWASVLPVVSSAKNSKVIAVSTPNGASGLYYDIWQQANDKSNKNTEGWKPFRVDWWEVPGRTEAWKEKQIASIGIQRWRQEFGNEFMVNSSNAKLIPDDKIDQYAMKISEYKTLGVKPKKQRIISEKQDELFEFDMWHEFQPTHTYLASMDISEGTGQDSSVLYVWDVTDLSNIIMCAKFSSSTVSLVKFAYIVRTILALYNDPWLAGERNGVSAGTIDSLRITYQYTNICSENKKGEPGIFSHIQNKSKACLWAREMMTTTGFGFTIYDKDLIEEMKIFCKKDTKGGSIVFTALPGPNSHDDHMMAFIWMTYILQNDLINKYFIVVQSFKTELDQIYAKLLQPVNEYTTEQYLKIKSDPLYKDFLEFKEELAVKLNAAYEAERRDQENDTFNYKQYDPYFDSDDGDTWGRPAKQQGISLRSNFSVPTYAIT